MTALKNLQTFVAGGTGCLLLFGLFVALVLVCVGHFDHPWGGVPWAFGLGGTGSLAAVAFYHALRRADAEVLSSPPDFLAKATFWRVIYGDWERETPVETKLFPDRLVLNWGVLWWKTRVEIPWGELAIVPAATLWLGDDPSWDQKGLALRWTTATERFRGWKRVWLPCPPGSDFYREVQRLLASNHLEPA